ncbi:MAG: arsenite efflux transporter metallochaperone ArsD [Rhodothermaceae bacterium]|nr:arsenite efflux transporter metallochaperone ArsD [Rhodothermaceae bacterium]
MSNQTETKTVIEVYDPAMCCSTGVCGPDVDDSLADFANDVKWLKSQGVEVMRYNLGQEPEAFKACTPVLTRLQNEGSDVLPIILVNGEIVSEGGYPDRTTLMSWIGLNTSNGSQDAQTTEAQSAEPFYSDKVDILVAIGASIAAGCETCLKSHFVRGRKAGLTNQEMTQAMQTGLNIRQVPISQIVELSNKLLGVEPRPTNGCAPGGGCC